jgi:hypothetical protein
MSDTERGKIYNRRRASQIRDFSGLRFGSITPTDVDGLIEYRNQLFILMETKRRGVDLPRGQKLAFERLIDAIRTPAVLFVSEHEYEGDIDMAQTTVTKAYFRGRWHRIEPMPLVDAVNRFIAKWVT